MNYWRGVIEPCELVAVRMLRPVVIKNMTHFSITLYFQNLLLLKTRRPILQHPIKVASKASQLVTLFNKNRYL